MLKEIPFKRSLHKFWEGKVSGIVATWSELWGVCNLINSSQMYYQTDIYQRKTSSHTYWKFFVWYLWRSCSTLLDRAMWGLMARKPTRLIKLVTIFAWDFVRTSAKRLLFSFRHLEKWQQKNSCYLSQQVATRSLHVIILIRVQSHDHGTACNSREIMTW